MTPPTLMWGPGTLALLAALVLLFPGRGPPGARAFDKNQSPHHFVDDICFVRGGAWSLRATFSWELSQLALTSLYNRSLAHLLICDESVIGVSSRTLSVVPQGDRSSGKQGMSLLTKWQFCTEGNYGNLDLAALFHLQSERLHLDILTGCHRKPHSVRGDSLRHRRSVARRLTFTSVTKEVWGTDQEETRFGGTRYPESCRAPR